VDNGHVNYRRRNNGDVATKQVRGKTHHVDNSWLAPFNAWLIMRLHTDQSTVSNRISQTLLCRYDCHVNVELVVGGIRLVKYLYKYLNKGQDRCSMRIHTVDVPELRDELQVGFNITIHIVVFPFVILKFESK
jgi:hypothetical protein